MISIVIIVLQALLVENNMTENSTDSFIISQYAKRQEKISNISITDYLPTSPMTLSYSSVSEKMNIPYFYNVYPQGNYVVNYEGESEGDVIINNSSNGRRYTTTGSYYYDKENQCLTEITQSAFGNSSKVYLPAFGDKLKVTDGVVIELDDYLYTVYTQGDTYKDCVAAIKQDYSTDTTYTWVSYYAKGIGEVLTTNNYPDTSVMSVYSILTGTAKIMEEKSESESTVTGKADVNFLDGQRFECFETKSGEDIVMTVLLYEDSATTDVKAELSNGVEFWMKPYETVTNGTTYVVNCEDGTIAYVKHDDYSSMVELITTEGKLSDYAGAYIELPDEAENEENEASDIYEGYYMDDGQDELYINKNAYDYTISVSFYRLAGFGYVSGKEQDGKLLFSGYFDDGVSRVSGYIERVGNGAVSMVITESDNELVAENSQYDFFMQ